MSDSDIVQVMVPETIGHEPLICSENQFRRSTSSTFLTKQNRVHENIKILGIVRVDIISETYVLVIFVMCLYNHTYVHNETQCKMSGWGQKSRSYCSRFFLDA